MSKVLLVFPNILKDRSASPPLGLLYIAGTLLKNKIDTKIIDGYLNNHAFYAYLEKIIEEFKPDIAGITMFTCGRGSSLKAAAKIKTLKPDTTIVVGGSHPSLMYRDVLEQNISIDLVAIGEGETTMLEIAEGHPFSEIDGVAYRGNKDIVATNPRKLISDMDDIPFPAWHLVDLFKYHPVGHGLFNNILVDRIPNIAVAFSRGCLFNCSFCSSRTMWPYYRHRSAENMVDELELLNKKFHIKHFKFVDDLATQDKKAFGNMCDKIVKRNLKIAFEITTRADCLSEELLYKLKKAGCYNIILGIESGSDEILRGIKKRVTRKDGEFAIKLIKNMGIKATALIMIGNKGETRHTINETIDFLRETDPDEIRGACGVTILPGTAIYQIAKGEKLIDDDYWRTDKEPPIYTFEHTLSELHSFQRAMAARVKIPPKGSFLIGETILNMLNNLVTQDNRIYRAEIISKIILNYIYVRIKFFIHFLKISLFLRLVLFSLSL